MSRTACTAALLLLILAQAPAGAGTFSITGVWYSTSDSEARMYVLVAGQAQYFGTVDVNDDGYLLQTFINSSGGGSLDDWDNPDDWGAGLSGNGIYPGMVLTCSSSPCAADEWISKPICGTGAVYYKGKAGVTIYHQFSPEVDDGYGTVNSVGCYYDPYYEDSPIDPPGACSAGVVTETTVLSLTSGEAAAVPLSPYGLTRIERSSGMDFLMEEWAVLSYQDESLETPVKVNTLNASTERFAAVRTPAFRQALASAPEIRRKDKILVVDAPVHRRNSRYIPRPELVFDSDSPIGVNASGTLTVRADFSEGGDLTAFEVLDTTVPVTEELLTVLRDRVAVSYATAGRHRAVSFAVIDLDQRQARLLGSHTILPQCCCGTNETFCL